jgi:hypothetical protein
MTDIVLKVFIFVSKKDVPHLCREICLKFTLNNLNERTTFETYIAGRIVLGWILKVSEQEDVDLIYLGQVRGRC